MNWETATIWELEDEIQRMERAHGISDDDVCSLARMPELFGTGVGYPELLRARLAAMQTWS